MWRDSGARQRLRDRSTFLPTEILSSIFLTESLSHRLWELTASLRFEKLDVSGGGVFVSSRSSVATRRSSYCEAVHPRTSTRSSHVRSDVNAHNRSAAIAGSS